MLSRRAAPNGRTLRTLALRGGAPAFAALAAVALSQCAEGGALEDGPKGPGGTSALDSGPDVPSMGGTGALGGTGAMGGVGGSSGVGGVGGVGGAAGAPDAGPDQGTPDSGTGGTSDAAPDVVIDAGSAEACPGQRLTFSGAGPYTAKASGGTPSLNDTQGTCGGSMAPDGVYRFTAPVDGLATISYSTTAFDGVVYVRSTCGASATEFACANAVMGQGTETLQFSAVRNLDYFVWVDGAGPTGGLFVLDVSVAPTEPVDKCPGQALALSGSGTADRTGSATGNTTIRLHDSDGACSGSSARDEVWSVVADTDGILTVTVTPTGGWDPAVYVRGGTCAAGAELACGNAAAGAPEVVELWATSGSTYFVFVDGADMAAAGSYAIDVRLAPKKPNESCNGEAVTWTGTTSPRTFQVSGDTTQRWDDAAPSCGSTGRDVVYQVTPPANGTLTLDLTPGGGFDAVMQIREGACASGTELACVSNAAAGGLETHTLVVSQGTPYFVLVDGKTTSSAGTFTLAGTLVVAAPPERCPGETLTLTGTPRSATTTGDLGMFARDYTAPCAPLSGNGNDAVYHFRAPMNGNVTITLEPTTAFDPVLMVRSTDCVTGTQVSCADANGQGTGLARAEFAIFSAVQNTDYYVFVDAAATGGGAYRLNITY